MAESPMNPLILRAAYARGYFPMPDRSGKIGWYRPDPRAILPLGGFHCSRRLARRMRQGRLTVSFDRDFRGVMLACSERPTTWINADFLRAYGQLHDEGHAHSVEVWRDDRLVGGVYGLALGRAFFAESKFHRETDASKIALFHLVERLRNQGFQLLEVQFLTPHLASLGAIEVSDADYIRLLQAALANDGCFT